MRLGAAAAALVWTAASLPARERYRAALRDPRAAQVALLRNYLLANRETVFGSVHDFGGILEDGRRSADDLVAAYQARVPLAAYDDLEPLVTRIAAGEDGVLTRARVDRLAPSSGSTSAAKLVPQTRESSRELSRAVDAWIADLYWRLPRVMGGPAYWSITPSVAFDSLARHTDRPRVPIGFDEDSAYLGGMRQRLVNALLAVPPDVRLIADVSAFRYATQLFLLRARALRLISIWHPSFLLLLLDELETNAERLLDDLSRGGIDPRLPIDDAVRRRLEPMLPAMPSRAHELRRARDWTAGAVWPELTAISCWADGAARPYAARLAAACPGVALQPKGLIATEAIVSIPFAGQHPLAVRSHFFEFVDVGGGVRLADQLDAGEEYAVVVTTGSGLYRYRLGDRVRVDGYVGATPSIRFVGRADRVSDRFGEKLSDGFVASVLSRVLTDVPPPRFAMVAPEQTADGIAYTLLIDPHGSLPHGLASALERELRGNPHYAWCVELGQLRPARVVRVGPNADRAFLDVCVARGQRLGDVKPVALHHESGWERALGARA
ncbi:MAG TPA: GH3 auxin-responsive promoter family protein [Vicinamibacterales bacterium]|nr:GH3 auxin-responsive promoter family protein [Vicinamibacterales bacterium]